MLKHVILVRVLLYLQRKDTPFRFIDTHAGAGAYDLDSEAARRSPEWRDGVARLLRAKPPEAVANLLKPYIDALGEIDPAESRPLRYPGSPAIAQSLLRGYTAQIRQMPIHQHQVEIQSGRLQRHGLADVRRLLHPDGWQQFQEQHLQAKPEQRVVVNDQDIHGARAAGCLPRLYPLTVGRG